MAEGRVRLASGESLLKFLCKKKQLIKAEIEDFEIYDEQHPISQKK